MKHFTKLRDIDFRSKFRHWNNELQNRNRHRNFIPERAPSIDQFSNRNPSRILVERGWNFLSNSKLTSSGRNLVDKKWEIAWWNSDHKSTLKSHYIFKKLDDQLSILEIDVNFWSNSGWIFSPKQNRSRNQVEISSKKNGLFVDDISIMNRHPILITENMSSIRVETWSMFSSLKSKGNAPMRY